MNKKYNFFLTPLLTTYFLAVLYFIPSPVHAQSFGGAGLAIGSVLGHGNNGQSSQVGGFGEGNFSMKFGVRIDAYGLATYEYAPKDGYDNGTDLRLRPEVRGYIPLGAIQPFVGAGVQYSYFHSDQYGKSGLNYVTTVGVEVAGKHTLRASRLYTDRTNLNLNRLVAFRYGYDLLYPIGSKKWAIRFSAEYNRFKYQQLTGPGIGSYNDDSVAFRIGIVRAGRR